MAITAYKWDEDTLSGSPQGMPISVTSTDIASGVTVHTVADGNIEKIWVFANNTQTTAQNLTIRCNDESTTVDRVIQIPARSEKNVVIPGTLLKPSGNTIVITVANEGGSSGNVVVSGKIELRSNIPVN